MLSITDRKTKVRFSIFIHNEYYTVVGLGECGRAERFVGLQGFCPYYQWITAGALIPAFSHFFFIIGSPATLLVRADALLFYSLCTDHGRRTHTRFFPFLLYLIGSLILAAAILLFRADALLFYSFCTDPPPPPPMAAALLYFCSLGQTHSFLFSLWIRVDTPFLFSLDQGRRTPFVLSMDQGRLTPFLLSIDQGRRIFLFSLKLWQPHSFLLRSWQTPSFSVLSMNQGRRTPFLFSLWIRADALLSVLSMFSLNDHGRCTPFLCSLWIRADALLFVLC